MLMRRNVAAGIGSNEQREYCRAAQQRSDRKEPRYKWPTLLYFTLSKQTSLWHTRLLPSYYAVSQPLLSYPTS